MTGGGLTGGEPAVGGCEGGYLTGVEVARAMRRKKVMMRTREKAIVSSSWLRRRCDGLISVGAGEGSSISLLLYPPVGSDFSLYT